MLLQSAKSAFDDPAWTYELKYDGYRLMAWVGPTGPPRLKTRNGGDATQWFPEVVKGLEELPSGEHVLDGEVCVLDQYGRTDFNKLHARGMARRWKPGLEPVVYCVFDILVHKAVDVRHEPTRRRQSRLERLLQRGASSLLRVQGFVGEGRWLFEQAQLLELEGIVAKRLEAPYASGVRSDDWLKVKRKGATPPQRFARPPRGELKQGSDPP